MSVKHALTADGSPLVEAVDWNASHTVDDGSFVAAKLSATATDKVFGRSSSGAGNGEEIALTAAGRALIDDADAAAQRTTLGIATAITGTALDTLAATTDITTRNASTSAHGLLRKLDNDATHYLDGQGGWTVPAGGGGGAGALLGIVSYAPGSDAAIGTLNSTTLTAVDATNLTMTFTVPASGNVIFEFEAMIDIAAGSTNYFGILNGAGSTVAAKELHQSLASGDIRAHHTFYLTGLTPGSATWRIAYATDGGHTMGVYGGPTYGHAIMRATAA